MFTSGKTPAAPGLPAGSNGAPRPLFFNALPFAYPRQPIHMTFSTKPRRGMHRFPSSQVPALPGGELPQSPGIHYVYVRFHGEATAGSVAVDPAAHPEIARRWCLSRLVEVLSPQVDFCRIRRSAPPEFWCRAAEGSFPLPPGLEPSENGRGWDAFHRFTLQVEHSPETGTPQLVVGYNGAAHILQQSLDDLLGQETDTRLFRLLAFRRRIWFWDRLPAEAHYRPCRVFPVLNSALARATGTTRPPLQGPDRYDAALRLVAEFVQSYCLTDAFLQVVPHNGRFREVDAAGSGVLTAAGRRLLFGKGASHTDPLTGFRRYGPLHRPPGCHFRCFFIYFSNNTSAAELLQHHLWGRDNPGRVGLLTRTPLEYDPALNIVIGPTEDPELQVERALQQLAPDPQVVCCAFYIIPGPAQEQDDSRKRLYCRIRELLMYRHISVQGVTPQMLKGDFSTTACTLAYALVARLGGIPWHPDGTRPNDVVVGFSSPARELRQGVCTAFLPGGRYSGACLFPAGDSRWVAGLAIDAFRECRQQHPHVQRLVIHTPRPFTAAQMELLKKMLGDWQLDIPVVVAAIGRCRTSGLLVFAPGGGTAVPTDGTWTRCGGHSYLLNIHSGDRAPQSESGPAPQVLPLHIAFSCTRPGHLEEEGAIAGLLGQVYAFTRMHWHSPRPSALPVSLAWPDRLASFLPGFRNPSLPLYGRCVPWFL